MQRLWPVSFDYARKRHSMGYESTYVWRHKWNMIDDPMHSISQSLATWCNSVHPLCELAVLFHSKDHWAYLCHRLSAWARDTSLTSRAADMVFESKPVDMQSSLVMARSQLPPQSMFGASLSPVLEEGQAARPDETFQASDLVERIKTARMQIQGEN
jgi:hypothetical protein